MPPQAGLRHLWTAAHSCERLYTKVEVMGLQDRAERNRGPAGHRLDYGSGRSVGSNRVRNEHGQGGWCPLRSARPRFRIIDCRAALQIHPLTATNTRIATHAARLLPSGSGWFFELLAQRPIVQAGARSAALKRSIPARPAGSRSPASI